MGPLRLSYIVRLAKEGEQGFRLVGLHVVSELTGASPGSLCRGSI